MMYDEIDDTRVERDMFGREITTHNRRFSNGTPNSRAPTNARVQSISTPTEQSPLLPLYQIESDDEADQHDPQTLQERSGVEQTSAPDPDTVTKRRYYTTVILLILFFMSINAYFFYSLRALHSHTYHQHQQIIVLQRNEHNHYQDLNRRMQKIENMTSNEDVIDELHDTEHRLEKILNQEHREASRQMSQLQENVTVSVHRSEHLVDKKLANVDSKLSTTTSNIQALLAASEANVTREILSVSDKLEAEEKNLQVLHANVTRQLTQLGTYMNSSIQSVNVLVNDAKKKIKKEVNEVYASLDVYIASTSAQFAAENDFVKYQLAGSFSLLACLICLYHVTSHLRHFERPDVQRRVLAILWMVPIYSVTSWLQLVFPSSAEILSGIRDCYEAYVVYTFFAFLIAVLANTKIRATAGSIGNVHNAVVKLLARRIKDQRAQSAKENESVTGSPTTHSVKSSHDKHHVHSHPITAPCSCLRCAPAKSPLSSSRWCFCCPTFSCSLCCCRRAIPEATDEEKEGSGSGSGGSGGGEEAGENNTAAPATAVVDDDDDINSPRNIAASVLYQCTCMTLQFVLLKPLLAAMPLFFWLAGVDYEDHLYYNAQTGEVDWTSPKLYVLMVANISVSLAFYGLLSFYHTTEKDLAWCDPWPKFLCIKGVVFMTFWQYVGLQMMSGMGLVDEKTASQIQNLLICIEMFMASIAHFYVFPYEEWGRNYEKEQKKIGLFRDTLAFNDFVTDIGMMTARHTYEWDGDDDEYGDHTTASHTGNPRRRSSVGGTYQGGTTPLTSAELEKWQHSSPDGSPGVHSMQGRVQPPPPLPLGSMKQSRNIDQLLQSPSLAVSTPMLRAANDMNDRLSKHHKKRCSDDDEGSGSSEGSVTPRKSSSRPAEDEDLTSEHLDTLTPAVTPVSSKPLKIIFPPNSMSPAGDDTSDRESSDNGSTASDCKNEAPSDLTCDTDVEGFADREVVYTSPVRSLPPSKNSSPVNINAADQISLHCLLDIEQRLQLGVASSPPPEEQLHDPSGVWRDGGGSGGKGLGRELEERSSDRAFNHSARPFASIRGSQDPTPPINSSVLVNNNAPLFPVSTPLSRPGGGISQRDSTLLSSPVLPLSSSQQQVPAASQYTTPPPPPLRHPATAPVRLSNAGGGHVEVESDSDGSVQSV